jgi:DNA-binding transcriptional LysR family regulator
MELLARVAGMLEATNAGQTKTLTYSDRLCCWWSAYVPGAVKQLGEAKLPRLKTGVPKANELTIAIAAVKDGAGLIQLPLAYVVAEITDGRLVSVLADWARPPSGLKVALFRRSKGGQSSFRSAPGLQTSIFSAISMASSISCRGI